MGRLFSLLARAGAAAWQSARIAKLRAIAARAWAVAQNRERVGIVAERAVSSLPRNMQGTVSRVLAERYGIRLGAGGAPSMSKALVVVDAERGLGATAVIVKALMLAGNISLAWELYALLVGKEKAKASIDEMEAELRDFVGMKPGEEDLLDDPDEIAHSGSDVLMHVVDPENDGQLTAEDRDVLLSLYNATRRTCGSHDDVKTFLRAVKVFSERPDLLDQARRFS